MGGDDDAPPALLGDWREFRAKLVADEGVGRGWAARQAQQNLQLLESQNPELALEETWAHATGAAEVGGLLLATLDAPKLLGDEYWQAVVFIIRHDEQGTLGLILNRPTSLHMGRGRGGLPLTVEGMESMREAFGASPLYCGGFKAQQAITLLHGQRRLESCMEVVPGIYIGGQNAAVVEVTTGGLSQSDFRFFAGCCSWKPGELEQQISRGAWQPAACSRTLVLKQCLKLPVPLWRECMCLLGGEWAEAARRQRRIDEGSDSEEE